MVAVDFHEHNLFELLRRASGDKLDTLSFGLIGFDASNAIQIYNAAESCLTRFDPKRMIGADLFEEIALCMNNYLVAQRFQDALEDHQALDDTINYMLTYRMKPTKVKLRLLAKPCHPIRFIAIQPL
jgi:photoactive yellow protein